MKANIHSLCGRLTRLGHFFTSLNYFYFFHHCGSYLHTTCSCNIKQTEVVISTYLLGFFSSVALVNVAPNIGEKLGKLKVPWFPPGL